MIVFDIETGPAPIDELRALMPEWIDSVGEFNPADVKVGNLKDEAKIKEKTAAARLTHAATVAMAPERKAAYEAEFVGKAALDATLGRVLAIGTTHDGEFICVLGDEPPFDNEAELLRSFWRWIGKEPGPIVGHNIFGFDLPFLVRRSYLLDIDVPRDVRRGRYWSDRFVDTMDIWSCGSREFIKLDDLAKACGLPGKLDGVTGADFARLWAEDRETAREYLKRDVVTTWQVACRLQIA